MTIWDDMGRVMTTNADLWRHVSACGNVWRHVLANGAMGRYVPIHRDRYSVVVRGSTERTDVVDDPTTLLQTMHRTALSPGVLTPQRFRNTTMGRVTACASHRYARRGVCKGRHRLLYISSCIQRGCAAFQTYRTFPQAVIRSRHHEAC